MICLIWIYQPIVAQTYELEKSHISFFSEAPLENIDAQSGEAKSLFRSADANIAFQVPIKSFQFKKSLMQEHFNENYMESEKYPNATFTGIIKPYEKKTGQQKVIALGKLTIHGITRDVEIAGILEEKDGKIYMDATFPVSLTDYDIEIPKIMMYKIAETIDVKVQFIYKKAK